MKKEARNTAVSAGKWAMTVVRVLASGGYASVEK
jgi:hypothetical protein